MQNDQPEQQSVWDSHCHPQYHFPHPLGPLLQEEELHSRLETLLSGSAVRVYALIQPREQKKIREVFIRSIE